MAKTYVAHPEELPQKAAMLPQPQEGLKYDGTKVPLSKGVFQYFPRALYLIGQISLFGSIKYEWFNWQYLDDGIQRYIDGGSRHMLAPFIDGPYDDESGFLHMGHEAWCALAKLELTLREGTPARIEVVSEEE